MKALEKYDSYKSVHENLSDRFKEINTSEGTLDDLLAHLDRQKEKAIETTFTNLRKHFIDVFKEIVPMGSANIKMVKNSEDKV